MSSKALQCKQRLMELGAGELRTALARFYAAKGVEVTIASSQKSYKFFEVAIHTAGKRVCSGYGRSEDEATLNACRIAFETVIDTSASPDLSLFEEVLDGPPSEVSQFLRGSGLEALCSVLEREELGLAELKIIDREDLRRTLNLQPDAFERLWTKVETLRPKKVVGEVKAEGDIAALRAENEKLKSLLHLSSPPRYLLCPLTQELYTDPVCMADGYTYEREAAELWVDRHDVSPVTGQELGSRQLWENRCVREMVREYRSLLEVYKGRNGDPKRNLYQTSYGHHLPDPSQPQVEDLERQADELAGLFLRSRPRYQ